jgi:translation initiation factor IF-3
MAHPELGTKILDQVLGVVGEYVKVETQARLEGRNMSMVLSPDKKALDLRKAAGLAPPPIEEGELLDETDDEHDDEHDEQDASTDSVEVTEPVAADVAEQAAP